jgi:hypothetical protein
MLRTQAQCYKTFNLRNELESLSKPSLMFVSMGGAYPSEVNFQVLHSKDRFLD